MLHTISSPGLNARMWIMLAVSALLASVLVGVSGPRAHATTGAIAGTVTVSGGGAATGGCVYAYFYEDDDLTYIYDCVDASGDYIINGVPAGDAYLAFYYFDNAAGEWHDGASDLDTATPITVTAGATTTLDKTLGAAGIVSGLSLIHI